MKSNQRLMMAPRQTQVSVGPQSLNLEKRTVEVVFATSTPVMRSDPMLGRFWEVLDLRSEAVDLSTINSGKAPVLDSHNNSTIENILGVVESARIQNGQGIATLRFSNTPKGDLAMQMVKDGTLTSVSVGYAIQKLEETRQSKGDVPTYTVAKWRPFEVSMVGVPADKNSTIRTENQIQTEVEVTSERSDMSLTQKERERIKFINSMVRSGNLEQNEADELIENETPREEISKRILESLEAKQGPTINPMVRTNTHSYSQEEHRKQCFTEAILHRLDSTNFKVTEHGQHLYGRSLIQACEFIVPRNTLESEFSYVKRVMSSSDLPFLLANAGEKSMQQAYQLAPKSYTLWTKPATLRNYKEATQIGLSDFSSLEERQEGAEYKYGSISEKKEVAQLKEWGKIHAFTNRMIVNDDLSGLQKLSQGAGLAASRRDNIEAYSALTTNKTMADGVALYHADHGNLGTPGAIGETTITEAFQKMMAQKTVGGLDRISAIPKFLLVGPDQIANAKKALAAINATKTSDVNPWSGELELVVDAEIGSGQFYFAADPYQVDTVTLFRLEGNEAPKFSTKVDFGTEALLLKVAYSVFAAPMDWRGLVKNTTT